MILMKGIDILKLDAAGSEELKESVLAPFPHQREMMRALIEVRMAGKEKALGVMASGTGKTLVVAFDTQGYFIHSEPNVLIICHSKQLLYQHKEEFQRVFGDTCKYGMFIGPEKSIDEDTNFVFATFQSLREHLEEFSPDMFDYIWVDEAHHTPAKTFLTVVNHFRPKFLLGLTATPIREDGASLDDTFGAPIYELDLIEAWHRDLLSPVECKVFTDYIEGIEAYLDSGEKVSWKQLNNSVFVEQRDEKIIDIVSGYIKPDSTTVFFCRNIAHAERIAKLIPEAETIHSELSDKKIAERLDAFRKGELRIITVVDMLNEGIDIPRIDNLVFLRPTKSLRILLQELGRGLRKMPGKDRVMVYDFVDNCEHLEMLFNLERTEKEWISNNPDPNRKRRICFELTIETPKFRERKLDIMELLERARRRRNNYSDEELIEMLREYAKELGRVPRAEDVHANPSMPSETTYLYHFGSWNKALQIADLQVNIHVATDEELLEKLKSFADELGRIPTSEDIDSNPSMPSRSTYRSRFGSWNKALQMVGLQTNKRILTDEELLGMLKRFADELGRTPTAKEVKSNPSMPDSTVYSRRFGSWNKALQVAGLQVNSHTAADEELLEMLREFASELGRTPTIDEVIVNPSMPHYSLYKKRFGSWNNAIRMVGDLQINRFDRNLPDKELLDTLRNFASELGRIPRTEDVDANPSMPHHTLYERRFGGWNKALQMVGLQTNKRILTDEELLGMLKEFAGELGRTPITREVNENPSMPHYTTYKRHFGSWDNALELAGLKSAKK